MLTQYSLSLRNKTCWSANVHPAPQKNVFRSDFFPKKIKVTSGIFQPMRIGQIGRTSEKSTNQSTKPARNRTALANARTHILIHTAGQPHLHIHTHTRGTHARRLPHAFLFRGQINHTSRRLG